MAKKVLIISSSPRKGGNSDLLCDEFMKGGAGRNLPEKEFRYLRTVIVTAAVYWGLNSKLRLR